MARDSRRLVFWAVLVLVLAIVAALAVKWFYPSGEGPPPSRPGPVAEPARQAAPATEPVSGPATVSAQVPASSTRPRT